MRATLAPFSPGDAAWQVAGGGSDIRRRTERPCPRQPLQCVTASGARRAVHRASWRTPADFEHVSGVLLAALTEQAIAYANAMPCVEPRAPAVSAPACVAVAGAHAVPDPTLPCAGIPFVLEIWPAGHNSPIHNHGNAYGIVRMLHGDITGAPSLRLCLPASPRRPHDSRLPLRMPTGRGALRVAVGCRTTCAVRHVGVVDKPACRGALDGVKLG